jgi:inosine-uridine nucleoside N-ribohydrolase
LIKAILDVDTGIDDALAIALAVRHPEVQLEAVVTVAGNVRLELTTRNTLRVLDWLGATDVPVYAGADRPLRREPIDASNWHGVDGLGGAELPEPGRAAHPNGVEYLCERVLAEPGELTLVCTAPLTNLALAFQREPRIVERVREVVVMGGAARRTGNTTPVAEFNIYADPDAAAVVFQQAWPITMVGLDVTEQVTLTRAERQTLAARTSPEAVLVREATRRVFDVVGVPSMALHDPLAMAIAVQPDLVTTIHRDVHVETRGQHTLGETVVDLRPSAPPPGLNTRVCTEVDAARAKYFFFATLFEPLGL